MDGTTIQWVEGSAPTDCRQAGWRKSVQRPAGGLAVEGRTFHSTTERTNWNSPAGEKEKKIQWPLIPPEPGTAATSSLQARYLTRRPLPRSDSCTVMSRLLPFASTRNGASHLKSAIQSLPGFSFQSFSGDRPVFFFPAHREALR